MGCGAWSRSARGSRPHDFNGVQPSSASSATGPTGKPRKSDEVQPLIEHRGSNEGASSQAGPSAKPPKADDVQPLVHHQELKGRLGSQECREQAGGKSLDEELRDFTFLTRGRPQVSIPRVEYRGILSSQLKHLLVFVQRHSGSWTDKGSGAALSAETMNLYQLSDEVIRPMTRAAKCSYVESVALFPLGQKPRWFVSHWWGETVTQLVACVLKHSIVRGGAPLSLTSWICAFANNQHELCSEYGFNPEDSAFSRALTMVDGVLLILDRNSTALSRIWCCFEESFIVHRTIGSRDAPLLLDIATAISQGSNTEVQLLTEGLTLVEREMERMHRFKPSVQSGWTAKRNREAGFPVGIVRQGLEVNIVEAQASMEIDRVRILNSIASRPTESLDSEPDLSLDVYEEVNSALRSMFALSSWRIIAEEEGSLDACEAAMSKDTRRMNLSLDLGQFEKLSNSQFRQLARCVSLMVSLKFLGVNCCGCKNLSDIEELGRGLANLRDIERLELVFSGCPLTSIDTISTSIGTLQSLRTLKLNLGSAETLLCLSALGQGLQTGSRALTELELILDNLIAVKDYSQLFQGISSLRCLRSLTLSLQYCNLTDTDALASCLSNLKLLKDLELRLAMSPALTSIDAVALQLPQLDLESLSLHFGGLAALQSVDGLVRAVELLAILHSENKLRLFTLHVNACRGLPKAFNVVFRSPVTFLDAVKKSKLI